MALSDLQTDLSRAALALPASFMTEQWMGSHVFKVGRAPNLDEGANDRGTFRMFAILNPGRDELSLKCPNADVFELLVETGLGRRHTHLPRGNWVTLDTSKLEVNDLCERIVESYRTVLPALPARVRTELGLN